MKFVPPILRRNDARQLLFGFRAVNPLSQHLEAVRISVILISIGLDVYGRTAHFVAHEVHPRHMIYIANHFDSDTDSERDTANQTPREECFSSARLHCFYHPAL